MPLGRISGVHGIKGWVKVQSYTEPRENIARFDGWVVDKDGERRRVEIESSRGQAKSVLIKLRGVDDRDAALRLIGATIAVERQVLPPCGPGEYYWADLEGLSVRNEAGAVLGTIDHLTATAAHDVLVLDGDDRRLIPFVWGKTVRRIDLEAGVVIVDWDVSYWD